MEALLLCKGIKNIADRGGRRLLTWHEQSWKKESRSGIGSKTFVVLFVLILFLSHLQVWYFEWHLHPQEGVAIILYLLLTDRLNWACTHKFNSIHHISFKCSVPITSRMSDVSHHKPQIATIPAPYVGQKWTWMWFRASNMCGKCPRHLLPSQARNIGGSARQMQLLFCPFGTNDLLFWTMNTTIGLKIQRAIWWIRFR